MLLNNVKYTLAYSFFTFSKHGFGNSMNFKLTPEVLNDLSKIIIGFLQL